MTKSTWSHRRRWRRDVAAPSVQIEDVPAETHAVLRRAAPAHQSLQDYLLAGLVEEAGTPTLDGVLERAGARAGGSLSLTAVRDRR